MIDTHERNAHAARRPGQRRLKVGDGKVGAEDLEFAKHLVHKRAQQPRLVVEAGGDRLHDVEASAAVLKDDPWNLLDPHSRVARGELLTEEGEGVGGGPDEHIVVSLQATNERAHPGRVAAALTAQTDGNPGHGRMAEDGGARRYGGPHRVGLSPEERGFASGPGAVLLDRPSVAYHAGEVRQEMA